MERSETVTARMKKLTASAASRNICRRLSLRSILRPFRFPAGGDIKKIQIGGECHDSNLGKIQYLLPIDGSRFLPGRGSSIMAAGVTQRIKRISEGQGVKGEA